MNTDHTTSSVIVKGYKIAFVYENQEVEYASFSIYDGCPEHDDNAVKSKEGDTIYIKDFNECYVFYTDRDMMELEYEGARLEHSTYRRKTNRNISKSPGRRYGKISNAAIKGYNDEQLSKVSVQDCKSACDKRPWCKSFDYYKYKAKCDLSSKSYHEVGLKRNYPGNPYDHYIKK